MLTKVGKIAAAFTMIGGLFLVQPVTAEAALEECTQDDWYIVGCFNGVECGPSLPPDDYWCSATSGCWITYQGSQRIVNFWEGCFSNGDMPCSNVFPCT